MNKLGANRYGKNQIKRFELRMNSICFVSNFQAHYPVTPLLPAAVASKISSKASQLCKTGSKDFVLAVHLVRDNGAMQLQ